MTKCQKCETWMTREGPLCSACSDTLGKIGAKVAEHKDDQFYRDYMLAKAAAAVLVELKPKGNDPAFKRAWANLFSVDVKIAAWTISMTTPRRRGQEKDAAK